MASAVLPNAAKRVFSPETLRLAAKQSQGVLVIPLRLRRAIKRYLRERQKPHMKRNVLRLSESFNGLKGANILLSSSSSRDLVEDPSRSEELQSGRWKIQSAYGDIGLKYGDDETAAYVAARMPAVFSACHRVLREVRRRIPEFSPTRVLDFGAGPGTAMWAVRQVWPRSLEHINMVEPSQDMQRTRQSLLQGLKNVPFIQSFDSLELLNKKLRKTERKHDLVISSYALGEIPSINDRITIVRQLWSLTRDVLVLVEPGTPQGYKIISQMRSHILWMAKRKCQKIKVKSSKIPSEIVNVSEDMSSIKDNAYVVAPCPHDGRCPLENTTKYCHFVQRLERTSVQRAYKRSGTGRLPRGFEDEKFCFVALRRGERPLDAWPLDGMKFQSLKEQKESKRHAKDHIVDPAQDDPPELDIAQDDPLELDIDEDDPPELDIDEPVKHEDNLIKFASDNSEADDTDNDLDDPSDRHDVVRAGLGGGWGRIIYSPVRRGRLVEMNVCQSTKRDCSEGAFGRVVLTKSNNPTLHLQARKSLWGDLWPCGAEEEPGAQSEVTAMRSDISSCPKVVVDQDSPQVGR